VLSIGSEIRFRASFSNLAGALTDPTTTTLKVRPPGGSQTSYTYAGGQLTKESTGVYTMLFVVATAGTWLYRWEAAGALIVTTPDREFTVYGTSFT